MTVLRTAIIVVAFIVLSILIYSYFRNSPEKYIKKAIRMHKKAEKYHNLYDEELANDYYEEAETYRRKAKELEDSI